MPGRHFGSVKNWNIASNVQGREILVYRGRLILPRYVYPHRMVNEMWNELVAASIILLLVLQFPIYVRLVTDIRKRNGKDQEVRIIDQKPSS
jgi:hypothetical protein